jgi:hypothetical protein
MNYVKKGHSKEVRINLAMDHYLKTKSGPNPGFMPAQPSKMRSTVDETGIVTLRNQHEVLAKLRIHEDWRIEELAFDPREKRQGDLDVRITEEVISLIERLLDKGDADRTERVYIWTLISEVCGNRARMLANDDILR